MWRMGGDPPEVGVDNHGPYSEGDHRHNRHRPDGYPVEGGGGAVDTCLRASLHMYNAIHGFRARRGTGTAIM